MRKKLSSMGWLALVGATGLLCLADTKPEEPVGLVLNPGGGKILRADTETPLALRPGDLLFSGDAVRTETSPASYLYCPAKTIQTLSASGEVRLDAKAPKVKTGKISEVPARACTLPQTLRVAVASQQHYGVTMTRGDVTGGVPPTPRDQLPADLRTALAPLDAALAADPKDPGALVAEAKLFEDGNLPANALEVYGKLRAQWPDADWIKSKMFDLQQLAVVPVAPLPGGNTYALLIGVSTYKKPELNLQFAHADAGDMSRFLQSPRGGSVPAGNILLLTNEKATTGAVRNGFKDFLKSRAGKNDTVIILVAGHGTVEVPGTQKSYILTYDADPQDLTSTALPMAELQDLFSKQIPNVGRILMFVDVCHSGVIGTIKNTSPNGDVAEEIKAPMLLAARASELSEEGPQFGGGHGVFSYYLLKGLQGEADDDKNGKVDLSELIEYVRTQVRKATGRKQTPQESGTDGPILMFAMSDLSKPGMDNFTQWPVLRDARTGEATYLASAQQTPLPSEASSALERYSQALQGGRLLPNQAGNAFDALRPLRNQLPQERYKDAENQLRIALEDKGQETLLRYLAGDENPQTQADFDLAGRYMIAARSLTPESLYLESRQDFFEGRTLLFTDQRAKEPEQNKTKRFNDAVDLLEKAVRLDPGAAYGYNALGIAYLEEAKFDQAIPAFRDAARRAQHWSYPLHNLALAYVETGDTRSAIKAYQDAIRLTPQYSYLPYNLGLVYQRLNRRKDAEASYRKALMLAPNSAEPLNALGTLKASEGKREEAEQFYKQALMRNANLLPARHNLGLLLAEEKGRQMEAVDLFRANLSQSPDYLPSRLSLAETLAASGDSKGAIEEYRKVLLDKPGYIAAQLALAQLLAKTGDSAGALMELKQASGSDNQNPEVLEQIGDLEAGSGHKTEAQSAYDQALKVTSDSAARKRLKRKLSTLH